jgi:hypothetical protein
MKIENLRMPPFNTTLSGVVKGVLDYYGIKVSDAAAFGGSGHAFLINIHDELCPSGPYCWEYDWFYTLVHNLGVEMVDLGFFHPGSSAAERAAVERKVKESLDKGLPCSLMNMENQLITGYDDKALFSFQPWGDKCGGFPPATLTYGTWSELKDSVHITFFVFGKLAKKDDEVIIRDSLRQAVDLFEHPERYSRERYGIGPKAYDNWLKAVAAGHGGEHGNWWNATVWSECRQMASAWFAEIADGQKRINGPARELSGAYGGIAALLAKAANKEMPAAEKTSILKDLKAKELAAVAQVGKLLPLVA